MVFAKPGIIRLDPREKYGFDPEWVDEQLMRYMRYKPGIPPGGKFPVRPLPMPKFPIRDVKPVKPQPKPPVRELKPVGMPKQSIQKKPVEIPLPKPKQGQDSGQVRGVNLIDFEMTALPGAGGGAKKTEHETKRVGGYKLIVPKKPEEKEIKRIENATKTQPDTDGLLKFVRMVGILAVVIVLIGLFIGGRKK